VQGYPNALVRLDLPLRPFFETTTAIGTTQHWALAQGDLRGGISKVAYLLGIDCTILGTA